MSGVAAKLNGRRWTSETLVVIVHTWGGHFRRSASYGEGPLTAAYDAELTVRALPFRPDFELHEPALETLYRLTIRDGGAKLFAYMKGQGLVTLAVDAPTHVLLNTTCVYCLRSDEWRRGRPPGYHAPWDV